MLDLEDLPGLDQPTTGWKDYLKRLAGTTVPEEQTYLVARAAQHAEKPYHWLRSYLMRLKPGSRPPIDNVYHACVQKTGSRWMVAVLQDRRVRRASGLSVFPKFRYEFGEFHRRFPKYTFVPGLYIRRGLYEEIVKPENYRTIYVMRDPRDIIVSWYYSMRDSHRPNPIVMEHRRALQDRSVEEGIAYCIRSYQHKLSFMRSWAYAKDDPMTLFVKLEDLAADPVEEFDRIMSHCQIPMGEEELEEILADYTKEKMRARDRFVRGDPELSTYRERPSSWQEVFTERNHELFRDVAGNLVELLGYKPSTE